MMLGVFFSDASALSWANVITLLTGRFRIVRTRRGSGIEWPNSVRRSGRGLRCEHLAQPLGRHTRRLTEKSTPFLCSDPLLCMFPKVQIRVLWYLISYA